MRRILSNPPPQGEGDRATRGGGVQRKAAAAAGALPRAFVQHPSTSLRLVPLPYPGRI